LERFYEALRTKLKNQYVERRRRFSNPIVAAKRLKFTPKCKRKINDENAEPQNNSNQN
jgi:hypothetical protein